MSAYFAELNDLFPTGFDAGDALTIDADKFDPPRGVFVLAHHGEEEVGCGGLQSMDAVTAEIKRTWIASAWRGLGLALRLLAELEARCAAVGYRTVRLDTNAVLTTAIALYERSGYHAIDRYNDNPYAHHWFEKHLDRGTPSASSRLCSPQSL